MCIENDLHRTIVGEEAFHTLCRWCETGCFGKDGEKRGYLLTDGALCSSQTAPFNAFSKCMKIITFFLPI